VSQPAPTSLQFRLLCNLTAEWFADFQPFSDPIYQPLAKEKFGAIAEDIKAIETWEVRM
jgi:hypothetical protein